MSASGGDQASRWVGAGGGCWGAWRLAGPWEEEEELHPKLWAKLQAHHFTPRPENQTVSKQTP